MARHATGRYPIAPFPQREILMTPFQVLVGFVAAAASFSAVAHDTLGRDWCLDPEIEPQILGEFAFNKQELHKLSKNELIVPSPVLDKCGMVDRSLWHSAMHISTNYCERLAVLLSDSQSDISVENVRAVVLEPSSYLEPEHHSEYSFSEGLSGVCVFCPSKR